MTPVGERQVGVWLRYWKADLVCLSETKLGSMDPAQVGEILGTRLWEWRDLPARGTAGGILIGWKSDRLKLVDIRRGENSISCLFLSIENDLQWVYTGVYGPGEGVRRSDFWEELRRVRVEWDSPWIVGGDFNTVLFPSERSRTAQDSACMREFRDLVAELMLVDLPLIGGRYTWTSNREVASFSRIDRFLVSPEWETLVPDILQKLLPRVASDHHPILLHMNGIKWGPTPFRFENYWLRQEGFVERIKGWWESFEVEGNASFRLIKKLRLLKEQLKTWKEGRTTNDLKRQKEILLEELERLDKQEIDEGIDEEGRLRRACIKKHLAEVCRWEEIAWRQRSRELWLREGDKNTAFFHRSACVHRSFNFLRRIIIKGNTLEDLEVMKENICDFYKKLYTQLCGYKPRLARVEFKRVEEEKAQSLERPFTREEVKNAVMDSDGDKAPGPDGFTLAFFKENWSLVEDDVMALFDEFHSSGKFVRSMNSTFICLIPKKKGAENISDFRPISLVSSTYKIVSKVLAERLRTVMGSLVSPFQHAFVGGRQSFDAALIANEVVDTCVRRGDDGVICKLDMEKAYDHFSWECLLEIMGRMGFGD